MTTHSSLFKPHQHGHANGHGHHGLPSPMSPSDPDRKLMKQSQKLVSQAFFGTMLKQMRNSPFKSKLFSGGRGGEAFSTVLDQHLADRMASGTGTRLPSAIFHSLKRAQERHTAPASAGSIPQSPAQKSELFRQNSTRFQGRQAPNPGANIRRPNVTADLRA